MSSLSTTPNGGSDRGGWPISRREALRLLAAQMALAVSGCGKPDEEILPYIRQPERVVPGEPLRFATTLPLAGYGRGAVGVCIDGRPIKLWGNRSHPASLGATDVFTEAAIFGLYDPDRSRTVLQDGAIASWDMLLKALLPRRDAWRQNRREGLRLLTGRITSPTLLRQIDLLLAQNPGARWHAYEPIDDDAERAGTILAYGRPLTPLPRLGDADIVLTLDADPLGPGPDQIRNARAWSERRSRLDGLTRHYAVEAAPTLTGIKADERISLHPNRIEEIAAAVANAFGAGLPKPDLPRDVARFVEGCTRDLAERSGLVLGGRTLSPECHALVHWINARLRAPVDFIEPVDTVRGRSPDRLDALAEDLHGGRVETLVVLGANPVFDAPAELDMAAALKRATFSLHLGPYRDETAALCSWHVPESHALESWSDLRARDGTASVVQPLIRPLYDTRTAHDLLAILSGRMDAKTYDLVRETWRTVAGDDFETWWRKVLHDGVIAGTAATPLSVAVPAVPEIKPSRPSDGLAIVLRPSDAVWDGRFANNAWLQECPSPIAKQVWGNALALGPEEARKRDLAEGDVVRIEFGGKAIEAPVAIIAGHAPGVASLALGYGRMRAGAIGTGVGVSAYPLRSLADPWLVQSVRLSKADRRDEILNTQNYVRLDGSRRDLFPTISIAQIAAGAAVPQTPEKPPSLYPDWSYEGHAWGMVIDTAACIGCNACVVACQAENNVPVVGPEEIAQGRDMHWLRIDIYDHGTAERPQPGFQPVPCMHCEQAPCEPVCPVAASVHDHEGLNAQVYNRCVGTRFCEANCPYKVRRFNFFAYADGQEYANLGAEPFKAQKNPEVTVRTRGVMEKCTYCVQRISRARRAAEREHRPLADGEVTTACQDACPTRAITFGDLNLAGSAVQAGKKGPRHYVLLGHLGTRPRTTYLAEVKNPNPMLTGEGK